MCGQACNAVLLLKKKHTPRQACNAVDLLMNEAHLSSEMAKAVTDV